MIVRCRTNQMQSCQLPAYYNQTSGGSPKGSHTTSPDWIFDLSIGQDYVVYVVEGYADGSACFLSCGEDYESCGSIPKLYPAGLFSVVDGRIPECWQIDYNIDRKGSRATLLIAYPEWFTRPSHHFYISETVAEDVAIWTKYKDLIDSQSK